MNLDASVDVLDAPWCIVLFKNSFWFLRFELVNESKKANRVLSMLKIHFYRRYPRLWRNLYVALVRPHLEYAVQFKTLIFADETTVYCESDSISSTEAILSGFR